MSNLKQSLLNKLRSMVNKASFGNELYKLEIKYHDNYGISEGEVTSIVVSSEEHVLQLIIDNHINTDENGSFEFILSEVV